MGDLIMMLCFMALSIALIIVSCVIKSKIKKNCTVKVEAVVEDQSGHYSYSSNHKYHVNIYGYFYNGIHYTAQAKNKFGTSAPGTRQIIVIDPNDPQSFYRKQDLVIPGCVFWIGILIFCISVFYTIQILISL